MSSYSTDTTDNMNSILAFPESGNFEEPEKKHW